MTRRTVLGLNPIHTAALVAQAPRFQAEVRLVSVRARVADRKGRPVGGLPEASFEVLEDDVPQKISFFDAGELPVSLGILLDTSLSMRESGKLVQGKTAIEKAIASGHAEDETFFIAFSDHVESIVESGGRDRRSMLPGVSNANAGRSGTALYDAISIGLCRLRRAHYPRQALLVLTDGADQHSRLTLEDVSAEIQRAAALVYLIGCFSREEDERYSGSTESIVLVSGRQVDNPRRAFSRLADESAAEVHFPRSATHLGAAIDSIQRNLRAQYTLGYYSTGGTPGFRSIVVRLRDSTYRVRARRRISFGESNIRFDTSECGISRTQHPYPYERRVAAENGRLLFREDFSDPGTGWPVRDSSWYGSGEYHIERTRSNQEEGEMTLSANGPSWEDIEASVSVRLIDAGLSQWSNAFSPAPPGAGLVVRLNERGCYALLNSFHSVSSLVVDLLFRLRLSAGHGPASPEHSRGIIPPTWWSTSASCCCTPFAPRRPCSRS